MLAIRDLHVYYGGIHALNGISLDVPDGQIISLIGANGAGKSTTLKAIMGLVNKAEGNVYWDSTDITARKTKDIVSEGIILCPEGRRIFPDLTVEENLSAGAYLRKDKNGIAQDREWVYSLFPRLKERTWQLGATLSGGELQRIKLASKLDERGQIFILDEPTDGLHLDDIRRLMELFNKMTDQGNTLFIIEHSLDVMKDADYIVELGPEGGLAGGKLLFAGTPKEMLESSSSVTREYLKDNL